MRLALVLVLCSCVRSHTTVCGDFTCPEDSACVEYTPLGTQFCIAADDARCTGLPDGALCDDQHGTCFGGGCFPVGCGNGAIDDPSFGRAEQCDDGNRLSHDGCSSACTIEQAAWDDITVGPPPIVSEHSAAYDASRDQVVTFGGRGVNGVRTGETWLRAGDGGWWKPRSGAFSPEPRYDSALAYDGAREQVVMFGGRPNAQDQLRDTWVWDGATWSPRTPAHAPPLRGGEAMAYDPIRGVVVMFGGTNGKNVPFSDSWLWDGADWTAVSGGPAAGMVHHAMAFDPVRGETVMVGETGGHVETWRFDGAVWTRAPGAQPPGATDIALAWDPAGQQLVLSGPGPQQWTWNGSAWAGATTSPLPDGDAAAASATVRTGVVTTGGHPASKTYAAAVASVWRFVRGAWMAEAPPAQPVALNAEGIAYDSDRGRVVMFGGLDSQISHRDDTWELSPAGWQLRVTPVHPTSAEREQLVYDANHHQMVRIGADVTDTWTWDGASWKKETGKLPLGLSLGSLAFDPASGVLVFGGFLNGGNQVTDTMLAWDGSTWTTLTPSPRPSPRAEGAMAYDPIAKKVILFGGVDPGSGTSYGDTWQWDGATRAWTLLEPTGTPSPRNAAALVWNPARQRLVLIGGAADTWEWDRDLETWVPLAVDGLPPTDVLAAVTAPDGTGVIVPSSPSSILAASNMTLARLRWSGPGALEGCSAADADGDGLAACDDPDCAAVCKLAAEHCGDATCGAGETCVLCPQDCGACAEICGDFLCGASETASSCPGDCP